MILTNGSQLIVNFPVEVIDLLGESCLVETMLEEHDYGRGH